MDILEITIQRRTDDGWPVVAEYRPANELTIRREGVWEIGTDELDEIVKKLLPHHHDPVGYGEILGRALFQNEVRDLFREARARTQGYLRVLLVVEDPTLKHLHWEWLSGPIRMGGKWGLLSLDQRLPFSLYLPSVTERHFPPLAKADLQALVLVANPPQGNPYKLASFEQNKTIGGVLQVLGDIPNKVLANGDGGAELPTIDHLATQLSGKQYTLLYIIAHGMFQSSTGETTLYLLDEHKQTSPVPATTLLERLDMVQGRYGLPHFVFLATCESADPKAEALDALGGLAQRMVRDLGIPAVVAMTQKVSIETANSLAVSFFTRLCEHGEVDRALVEACAGLASRGDIAVPTLYSRLEGRPLFAVGGLREPTAREVKAALDKLDALVDTRCPILDGQYRTLAQTIRALIDTANELLGDAARKEKEAALAAVNQLCEETLDLSFQGLALGQELPAYHAHECPFPGLYAFRVEDARFFFGREQVIQRLERHLMEHKFLAVLGPSGSGKSSVVLAGLIPQMQESFGANLVLHTMTPTETPVAQLEEIRAGLATDEAATHVLVVDQFEELFTLCRDETQRKAFLAALLSATNFRHVIITMRADFLGDCASYPHLADAVQNNLQLIAPMTTAELRSAMERQANQVHLRFEADLSHTILSEVEGEPGAMPLLQHLLRQLWERRHGRWLLTKEYRSLGGIRKAIAHTADELYEDKQTSAHERELLRRIFVRLTRIGEETTGEDTFRDTRQRIKQSTLEQTDVDVEQLRSLINRLATRRLIVTRQLDNEAGTELEVSHEALIRHWPRLQNWLNEDRIGLRLRQSIEQSAEEWDKEERQDNLLPRWNSRLEMIEELSQQPNFALNPLGQAYLEACIALRDREVTERERREKELRESLERAEREARIATAERLAVNTKDILAEESSHVYSRTLMLAREAVLVTHRADGDPIPNADAILRHTVNLAPPLKMKLPRKRHTDAVVGVYWSPCGNRLLTVSIDKTARIWDANTNRELTLFAEHEDGVSSADWRFDGKLVVTCSKDCSARIWDAKTGQQMFSLSDHKDGVNSAVWSPTGDQIVTTTDGSVVIWDAKTGQRIFQLADDDVCTKGADWSPDGKWIAVGGKGKLLRIWNALSGELAFEYEVHEGIRQIQSVAWHPAGDRIISGDWDGTLRLWGVKIVEQKVIVEIEHVHSLSSGINSVKWSYDGKLVAIGDFDSGVYVWSVDMKHEYYNSIFEVSNIALEQPIIRMQDRGAAISWHPDNIHIVTTAVQYKAYNYQVFIHALNGTQPFEFFLRHIGPILCADWSVDGTRVITAGYDGTIRIWDSETGTHIGCLRGHSGSVQSAKISPDNKYILSAGQDQTVRIWLHDTGEQLALLNEHDSWVNSVSWCPKAQRFITADSAGIALIWNSLSHQVICRLSAHTSAVIFAAFSPNGDRVITTSRDTTARIWCSTTGELIHTLTQHTDRIRSAAWHPNGNKVATVGLDHDIHIWDVENGNHLYKIDIRDQLHSVAWHPQGHLIAAAGKDKGIRLFDAVTSEQKALITGHLGLVLSLAWRHDGEALVCASDDSAVSIWNAQKFGKLWVLDKHSTSVHAAVWHPQQHRIATASGAVCQIWSVQSSEPINTLVGHEHNIRDVHWSCNGKYIATASNDGTARIWDAGAGKEVLVLRGHKYYVLAARFSPDGRWIATAGDDHIVCIWDINTGKQRHFIQSTAGSVTSIAWHMKGQLAYATAGGTIIIWDLMSQTEIIKLSVAENTVNSVAWSPDGSYLVAAYGGLLPSQKPGVRIWDVETGVEHALFTNHVGRVLSVIWSPVDELVASAGADKTVRIWNVKSKKQIRLLTEHSAEVNMVDWSQDGKWLVSASADRTARIWPARIEDLLGISQSLISRDPPVLNMDEKRQFNIAGEERLFR